MLCLYASSDIQCPSGHFYALHYKNISICIEVLGKCTNLNLLVVVCSYVHCLYMNEFVVLKILHSRAARMYGLPWLHMLLFKKLYMSGLRVSVDKCAQTV